MKNYPTWLRTAAIFQLLTAIIHATTLFVSLPPNNDTEKQLFALMDTYRFDFGAGFHRTMNELTTSFSASFSLLCLFGGLLNWYLLKKNTAPEIMKGVLNINLAVFGILFVVTVVFAFLMPIMMMGVIVLFLLLARITISKSS